jgi:hypothetical protein
MTLDLTEEETAALARLLTNTIDADRYPLSPRIQLLKGMLAKIQPEPERQPSPSRSLAASGQTRRFHRRSVTSRRAADDTADAVR